MPQQEYVQKWQILEQPSGWKPHSKEELLIIQYVYRFFTLKANQFLDLARTRDSR